MSAIVNKCGDKVKDLKSLFDLRLLSNIRAADFEKVIGEDVDET